MDLKEVMAQSRFAVVGNTLNPEKFAFKIKSALLDAGYTVHCVGQELPALDDVPGEIDVIDLCIHPSKGLALLRACTKPFKCVVLQPGSESPELLAYLQEKGLPYLEGCVLVGLKRFGKNG